jgi:hypothetical protein
MRRNRLETSFARNERQGTGRLPSEPASRVDSATGTVRVDLGCTSGDVDRATHAFEVVRGGTSNIVSSNEAVELTAGPRSLAAARAMQLPQI